MAQRFLGESGTSRPSLLTLFNVRTTTIKILSYTGKRGNDKQFIRQKHYLWGTEWRGIFKGGGKRGFGVGLLPSTRGFTILSTELSEIFQNVFSNGESWPASRTPAFYSYLDLQLLMPLRHEPGVEVEEVRGSAPSEAEKEALGRPRADQKAAGFQPGPGLTLPYHPTTSIRSV